MDFFAVKLDDFALWSRTKNLVSSWLKWRQKYFSTIFTAFPSQYKRIRLFSNKDEIGVDCVSPLLLFLSPDWLIFCHMIISHFIRWLSLIHSVFYLFSVSLWRRAYARNIRLYYTYPQYTNLFILRLILTYCLRRKWQLRSQEIGVLAINLVPRACAAHPKLWEWYCLAVI